MSMCVPPALVLGCNTPHGIGVLSDWIQEQTGYAPDLDGRSWSEGYVASTGNGYGDGCGYGCLFDEIEGSGDGRGYGDWDQDTYGASLDGRANGDGWGDAALYGDTRGDGCSSLFC